MSQPTTDDARRPRWPWIVGAIAVAATSVWYFWPSISGNPGNVAAAVDDGFFQKSDSLVAEVRVRGRDFVASGLYEDWCVLADEASDLGLGGDVEFFVVAIEQRGDCEGDPVADTFDALDDAGLEPVVVILPGSFLEQRQDDLAAAVRTVPVGALVGGTGARTMACEWWDDCPPEGVVEVRSADGDLTAVGLDRVARAVASSIG